MELRFEVGLDPDVSMVRTKLWELHFAGVEEETKEGDYTGSYGTHTSSDYGIVNKMKFVAVGTKKIKRLEYSSRPDGSEGSVVVTFYDYQFPEVRALIDLFEEVGVTFVTMANSIGEFDQTTIVRIRNKADNWIEGRRLGQH